MLYVVNLVQTDEIDSLASHQFSAIDEINYQFTAMNNKTFSLFVLSYYKMIESSGANKGNFNISFEEMTIIDIWYLLCRLIFQEI